MCYLGATYIYEKKRPEGRFFEPLPGLEPGTYALRMRCSTN